ncbi:hypothetical protein DY367_29635, partial [Achromobacter xylosoxidans]
PAGAVGRQRAAPCVRPGGLARRRRPAGPGRPARQRRNAAGLRLLLLRPRRTRDAGPCREAASRLAAGL